MQIIESLDAIRPADFASGSCVAIGKFDGLHLGHQAILERMRTAARSSGARSVAFTFANHPLSYLRPEACPRPLMSRAQRLEAIAGLGLDACVMVEFDEAFASIPAEEFVVDVLVGRLNAKHVLMGADFRFGHRGSGDGALLRALGERHGFTAEVLDWVEDDEAGQVSSSRIREALLAGDVEGAGRMTGRPVAVRGEVVHGDARGRELGFPTANLGGVIEGLVPADGVYAGWAVLDGVSHPAAISVGNNPTFTPDEVSRVEAYLLDFSDDIYGRTLEIRFAHRLRGMERFDGLDALVVQMHADVARARELLGA
ncbi:bifunctional riboflavin kinase/FAD synthetase [Leucobacter chromiiresistens]|uniref:Riboflavin biosynthesis protein n=1 Tax=Leucobacter chromiiresistens TaxID=1079994 RepID=A0A1H0YXX9_9MICO|nr:bifunctional riboflavin kinase/FAD synthetase [Leucobacter chromiiresistens]SDQ20069.1 FMN adenylyltransferase /riboflavin kinase [Leucobacter chromiiresistens]